MDFGPDQGEPSDFHNVWNPLPPAVPDVEPIRVGGRARPSISAEGEESRGYLVTRHRPARSSEDLLRPIETSAAKDAGSFVEQLVRSGQEAALWKACEVIGDALIPGAGQAIKAAHVAKNILDALRSLEEGHGFELPVPVVDLKGFGSLDLSITLCEAEPPSLPHLGARVSENWPGADLLNSINIDGAAAADTTAFVRTERGEIRATGDVGLTMEDLVQRAAERLRATGPTGESWMPLAAAYLSQTLREAAILLWYLDEPPYAFRINMLIKGERSTTTA